MMTRFGRGDKARRAPGRRWYLRLVTTELAIYKRRRVVVVHWKRGAQGDPHPQYPEVDDRGKPGPEHAAVIGLMEGKNAYVRLERTLIAHAADLYATSSDTSKVTVIKPAAGLLPHLGHTLVELHGVAGGNPNEAFIEIRYGSATGPIVSKLLVRCYTRLRVNLTPHLVTIHDSTGANGVVSTANVATIMDHVKAIWRPCGVDFVVGTTLNEVARFATANVVNNSPFPGEVATLLATRSVPNTINAYFVRTIGAGTILGYGFSRASSATFGTGTPGIILADQAGTWVHDPPWAGNDLAHESGHFFQLWHPNNQQIPAEREDTWARRMLMHNNNTQNPQNNWKDDNGYGAVSGTARRGGLVTHKHLARIATDNECTTARAAIVAGPY